MAGVLKVDSINADSNLALKIANTAVAFIDSSGLRPVGGNVNLDATATSKFYLPSANTVEIQTAGVTGLSVSSSQVVTLDHALPVGSGGTGATSLSSITVGTATLATTAANIAGGSNGTIPYQSANGTTQMLAVGTSGQLLQTNGAGAPSWVTPSAGALVLLSTVTASTSATVDIETTFNSTYDVYIIQATGVTVDTGNSGLSCRFKIGGSYIASGSPYSYAADHTGQADTTYQIDRNTTADKMEVIAGGDIGSASTLYTSFEMRIDQVASTAFHKTATWTGMSLDTGSVYLNQRGGGRISNAGALTGIRFFASSGNILAGKFRLYGVVNS